MEMRPKILTFPEVRKCPHCHAIVDDDARYCMRCGGKIEKVKRYAPQKKHTKVPLKTQEEITAMQRQLAKPTKNTAKKIALAKRNFTMFSLGICIGLRSSDLVVLRARQFDLRSNILYTIEKKTGKGREMILPDDVKEMMLQYINERGLSGDDYVFTSQQTRRGTVLIGEHPLEPHSWNDIIVDAARALGWDTILYGGHSVRKTYAYQFYTTANAISRERGYRALSVLCKNMNHVSEAQTLAYIGIAEEEVCEICNLTTAQYNLVYELARKDEEED